MVGTCVPAIAADSVAIETLFYTPAERVTINRSRQAAGGQGAESASYFRLSGVVRRQNARGTAWVNGQPIREAPPPGLQIRGVDAVVDGRRLKVGESVDSVSGARTDVVAPGAVTTEEMR